MFRSFAAVFAALALLAGPASAFKRTEVGDPIKDFRLPTVEGKTVVLAESLGAKATLVVFWAAWNPRSAEALADFQKLFAERAVQGLAVVAVNVEHQELTPEDLGKIKATVAELGLTYPVVLDKGLVVYNDYGVVAVPSALLVDGQGKVAELVQGYATTTRHDLEDRVLAALGVVTETPEAIASALPPAQGKAYRYLQMGELFIKRGMKERAEKAFRTAIQEDPGYVKAYEALAEVLEVQEKAKEAAEIRQKISSMAGK